MPSPARDSHRLAAAMRRTEPQGRAGRTGYVEGVAYGADTIVRAINAAMERISALISAENH
jgi:hypothetical protein